MEVAITQNISMTALKKTTCEILFNTIVIDADGKERLFIVGVLKTITLRNRIVKHHSLHGRREDRKEMCTSQSHIKKSCVEQGLESRGQRLNEPHMKGRRTMAEIRARVILDSQHSEGISRVITLELVYPRFVHSEMMTHRSLSRNSASSRAVPLSKKIAQVLEDPAIPVSFPKEQRGMSGGEEVDDRDEAVSLWLTARDYAVMYARALGDAGVHKSVCNRVIEPWMMHTVIATGTERAWASVFALRCNPLAQPEIRITMEHAQDAVAASIPVIREYGQWHLPFVDGYDLDQLVTGPGDVDGLEVAKHCSVARCARVSYETHDTGKRDVGADLKLFTRLVNPGEGPAHASPLEHVCTPVRPGIADVTLGNLWGWSQLRHVVLAEERIR